jgi:hypothetical protein
VFVGSFDQLPIADAGLSRPVDVHRRSVSAGWSVSRPSMGGRVKRGAVAPAAGEGVLAEDEDDILRTPRLPTTHVDDDRVHVRDMSRVAFFLTTGTCTGVSG